MVLMAEFSRTLALLASAGVSLVESLSIVNEVADSEVMRRALTQVGKDVEKGNTLAISLAKHTVFPMIVSQMTSVGEQAKARIEIESLDILKMNPNTRSKIYQPQWSQLLWLC
jgi:type IV pilus assembly protein PilC